MQNFNLALWSKCFFRKKYRSNRIKKRQAGCTGRCSPLNIPTVKRACCRINCSTPEIICHPERLKKIADFRKESKDLRTDLTANVPFVRRSFDSLRSLRMTRCGAAAFCNSPLIRYSAFSGSSGSEALAALTKAISSSPVMVSFSSRCSEISSRRARFSVSSALASA